MPAPTIKDLIEAALNESGSIGLSKIAEDAADAQEGATTCKKCGRPAVEGKELCAECAEKEVKDEAREEQVSEQEKTSSARLAKLAGAMTYLADHLHRIQFPSGPRLKTATEAGADSGPGHGPNTIPTDHDQPHTEAMPQDLLGQAKVPGPSDKMEPGANPLAAAASPKTDAEIEMPPNPLHFQGSTKESSIVTRMKRAALQLRKAAAESEAADIQTSHVKGTGFPEDQPDQVKRPAEVTSQEKALQSNEAAIDLTKAEAMAVPKKQLGEVLEEPAMSSATDKTLDNALGADVVDEAGAKVAAARSILQKLASRGCTCSTDSSNEPCQACKVASRLGMRKVGQAGSAPTADHNPDSVRA